MGSAITLILIVVVFVLLIIVPYRRQAQRQREVRAMQSALQPGTEVMTTSGVFGTVVSMGDTVVELEIAPGMVIRVARAAIGELVQPQQPALELGEADDPDAPAIEEPLDPDQHPDADPDLDEYEYEDEDEDQTRTATDGPDDTPPRPSPHPPEDNRP